MLSQHFLFITERITDIFKLEEESKVECSDDERIKKQRITKSVKELHKVLSRVVVYLRDVEQGCDEQQRDHHQLYLHQQLCHIADDSDDILNDTYDGYYTASGINNLVDRVHNFNLTLPLAPTYILNTGGNNNFSGQQRIGPINISTDQAESSQIKRVTRPKTYGEYPDSDLLGFEQEIQSLFDHLTEDNETRVVVGIVGMGGLGKTTLAKHIYHHPKCNQKFIKKVWVCISESWDKSRILKEISNQVIPLATQMEDDQLIRLLSQQLRNQSYLLVLDDMWSIDAWNHISPAFPPRSNGSKVVVTSRNKAVPQGFDGIIHIIEPKPLDDKESWELFKKKVLQPENISDKQLKLGQEMVKNCKGLPLAIVALAGVLKMGRTISYWERVSKTLGPNILQMNNESTQGFVNEILELSYDELPHHLKQCVLYLRLFPEDYEIDARKLLKMWIVEGHIRTNEEYTAEEYLDEIVQRYIVKVVKTNFMEQVVRIRIHDLIRQMLMDIDQKRGFLKDPLRLAPINGDDEQNRTLCSMERSDSIVLKRICGTETNSQVVRSIMFHDTLFLSEVNILPRFFEKFRLLRVLILCHIRTCQMMPEEIGNLIHLRYLELGGYIKSIKSIGNLGSLWTLDMRNIKSNVHMNFLCKLKELQHLFCLSYGQHILELGRLKKLKTLRKIVGGDWLLSTMSVLSADLHELRIHISRNFDKENSKGNSEEQLEEVFRTPSITSNNLQILDLSWSGFCYKLHDMNILSKCESLKKLRLKGLIKVGTPIVFPPNLIKLTLKFTYLEEGEVMNIISNSCPNLKILTLSLHAYVGSELVCNANSFLQLEKLTLAFGHDLRMWIIESNAMRNLHHLKIRGGKYMDLNPEGWTFILNIPQLTYEGPKETIFKEKLQLYSTFEKKLQLYSTFEEKLRVYQKK